MMNNKWKLQEYKIVFGMMDVYKLIQMPKLYNNLN